MQGTTSMEVSGSLSFDEEVERNGANEKLPHDLVIEILSWLHVKHLWPLRCVSKSWFHLLTKNPQFAKLQFDRLKDNLTDPIILGKLSRMRDENDSNLVFATEFTSCDKAFHVEFPFYQPTNTYLLSGISNGLLCISPSHCKEVYIWNPLTNDHITISCLPAPSIRFPRYRAHTKFGFGFDQVSNVYKVVRFFTENEGYGGLTLEEHDPRTQISVYTIGVDSTWRTVEVDIPHDLALICGISPLVSGVFHWNKKEVYSQDLIVTFDLSQEVISEFMVPPCIKVHDVAELSGMLCAIDTIGDKEHWHIWVMKEYGVLSSWSKQYVLEKSEGYMSTLGVTHNGEIILRRIFDNLVLYNPETNMMKDLERFRFAVFLAYAFLGSFISPTAISQGGHNLLEKKS